MVESYRIADLMQRTLELQSSYSSKFTQEMTERGSLLAELADIIRDVLQSDSLPFRVRESNGLGLAARVPWLNIADPERSSGPQSGFYAVYLFASDGSSVYLSLALGVEKLEKGELGSLVRSGRDGLVQLGPAATSSPTTSSINLVDRGSLARKYEAGTIEAVPYVNGSIPSDSVILSDLREITRRMMALPPRLTTATGADSRAPLDFEYLPPISSQADKLSRELTWPRERAEELLDVLAGSTPQAVLYGPPGTGKSYVAKRAATAALGTVDPQRTRFVQFHSSYGYEEFVEGLRPAATESSDLEFVRTPGVLMRLAKEVSTDGKSRVLVLDEMNRANLPRVFGELLYLLEYRDESIQLMLEENFRLPRELKIIGTMNTADRSAQSLDVALRRRFVFFELLPDVEVLRAHYRNGATNALGERLFRGFESMNARLREDLASTDLLVGHSYFMKQHMDERELGRIIRRQLRPLLEDYFFMDQSRLKDYRLDEVFSVNV